MSGLPAFILLKSNASGKFLCYGKNKLKDSGRGGGLTTNLSFSHEINTNLQQQQEEEVATADQLVVVPKSTAGIESSSDPIDFHMIKFEVEEAKTAPGLVHIRTCYNNKYLIRKCLESPTRKRKLSMESESSDSIISAEAHEAEEDQSKPTCTLFKPVFVEEISNEKEDYVFANKHGFGKPPQKIQLIHVSHFGQHYLGVGNDDNGRVQQLKAAYSDNSLNTTYFTAYDVQANTILPRHFTLMGHDDKYISGFSGDNLGFVTTDFGGKNVAMTTVRLSDPGYTIIWINESGTRRFWGLDSQNGVALAAISNSTLTVFAPVKAGNDHIALHEYRTGNFLHRVDAGEYDGVSATTMKTIMNQCKLRVGEPILSRTVSEPYYDLANARIYDTGNFQMYSDSRSNRTSLEQTGTFEVTYVKSHTTTWNQALTVNIGVAFEMKFRIPFVGSTGIELSTSLESTTDWGESSTEEETIRYSQDVRIPPQKKVLLRVLSTRSTCDVPLVCMVRDQMTDGTIREYTKTDILFTGINSYNFDTVLQEEDLP